MCVCVHVHMRYLEYEKSEAISSKVMEGLFCPFLTCLFSFFFFSKEKQSTAKTLMSV